MASIPWIKIETTLPNKPVIRFVRRACQCSTNEAIGLVLRVLAWADGITDDGVCVGYEPMDLDDHFGTPGLFDGLKDGGWLAQNDAGWVTFSEWQKHNGASAKRRATNARCNAEYKQKVSKNAHPQYTEFSQTAHLDNNDNPKGLSYNARRRVRERLESHATPPSADEQPTPALPHLEI